MWQELYQEWKRHGGRPSGYDFRLGHEVLLSSGIVDQLIHPYLSGQIEMINPYQAGLKLHGTVSRQVWPTRLKAVRRLPAWNVGEAHPSRTNFTPSFVHKQTLCEHGPGHHRREKCSRPYVSEPLRSGGDSYQ